MPFISELPIGCGSIDSLIENLHDFIYSRSQVERCRCRRPPRSAPAAERARCGARPPRMVQRARHAQYTRFARLNPVSHWECLVVRAHDKSVLVVLMLASHCVRTVVALWSMRVR